jgi:hypothetical protein
LVILAKGVVPDEASSLAGLLHSRELVLLALAHARVSIELVIGIACLLLGAQALAAVRTLDIVDVYLAAVLAALPLTHALTLGVVCHAHQGLIVLEVVLLVDVYDAHLIREWHSRKSRLKVGKNIKA